MLERASFRAHLVERGNANNFFVYCLLMSAAWDEEFTGGVNIDPSRMMTYLTGATGLNKRKIAAILDSLVADGDIMRDESGGITIPDYRATQLCGSTVRVQKHRSEKRYRNAHVTLHERYGNATDDQTIRRSDDQTIRPLPPDPPQGGDDQPPSRETASGDESEGSVMIRQKACGLTNDDIVSLYQHWAKHCSSMKGVPTRLPSGPKNKRSFRAQIVDLVAQGYDLETLRNAAVGISKRAWNKTRGFMSWELCYRDSKQVEMYLKEYDAHATLARMEEAQRNGTYDMWTDYTKGS